MLFRSIAPLSPVQVVLSAYSAGTLEPIFYGIPQEKQKMSFSHNLNSFNNSNFHLPDKRSEILEWLSPLEQWIRDKEVQSCRVPNVGDWLLHTKVFRSWSNASHQDEPDNAILFGYGDPGAGKTCIT